MRYIYIYIYERRINALYVDYKTVFNIIYLR